MTLSIREQVLQGFKAQLLTINPGSPTVTVARNTDDALALSSLPAVVMLDGGDQRQGGATGDGEFFGIDTYLLHVSVWGYLSAASDEDLGTSISDLKARVVKAMCADRTLGGKAQYLREVDMPDPAYDHEQHHRANAEIEMHFVVEYVTKTGDPYTAA